MKDFSHLEAPEKLFIAQHRLRLLSNALVEVLKLNEQKKAFTTSRLIISGHEDEAVQLLFGTIFDYEIAQTCRLWDEFDPNGFGIPTMVELLDGADVRKLLSNPGTEASDRIVNL